MSVRTVAPKRGGGRPPYTTNCILAGNQGRPTDEQEQKNVGKNKDRKVHSVPYQ